MTREPSIEQSLRLTTVKVKVDPEIAPRLAIGSRWEVVASSLDSLWGGPHTLTLRSVPDSDGARHPG